MKISELKPKQGNVEIQAEIIEISPVREFQKFGKSGRVANATIKDDSGQMTLTLWNEQIDLVKAGDKIEIKDGFVNEWQGDMQVTTGRNGTLTKL
ncbi:MAG: SOSS complex subunit B family protein [archaeon]